MAGIVALEASRERLLTELVRLEEAAVGTAGEERAKLERQIRITNIRLQDVSRRISFRVYATYYSEENE
jgi:hypothetical protein